MQPNTTQIGMVSLQAIQATPQSTEPTSSPRISFSAEFLDGRDFIPITPNPTPAEKVNHSAQFEFLSSNLNNQSMITADELFSGGKLLPFWKIQDPEELRKSSLKERDSKEVEGGGEDEEAKKQRKDESRLSWFADDDPSPRLPKCTVLWKELLRLKKQRPCSLSPSSSSSSSSSSSDGDLATVDDGKVNRAKKVLERTRSGSTIMRPVAMINVPICTQGKNNSPLFALRKSREVRMK